MADNPELDARNADFWNELCGTHLAREVGATGRTPEDLERFDKGFFDFYPYLESYLPAGRLDGARVLEIGLGYGTLGQFLINRGAAYTGVDISPGPVEMMRHRISLSEQETTCNAILGSALELPFEDAEFDFVYSIGCLHHTGDLPRSISEVRRVLRPGGATLVMVYDRASVIRAPLHGAARLLRLADDERMRAKYDIDRAGRAAPHTDFVSAAEARQLFSAFRSVRIQRRNVSSIPYVPAFRRLVLATRIDQLIGVNLYIQAVA